MRFLILVLLAVSRMLSAQTVSISAGEAPVPVVAPSVRVEFDTSADKFYRIESSGDLSNWKAEGHAFAGNGRRMSALVSNHGLPRLYYRIRNDASMADVAPVVPYSAVAHSPTIATAVPITAAEISPADHRLLVVDSRSPGSALRSITLGELANVPGFGTRWGAIEGSISDQADLMSALNGKYSAANPPGWGAIVNKPTTLFGYGIGDAVSTSSIGFMDRFARYPEGSVLSTGRSLPEFGQPWRFNIAGRTRIGATTISASAADSSFNDSAGGFLAQGLVPGDWLATWGFSNPANNGRFRLVSAQAGKITVTRDDGAPASLVGEAAGGTRNMDGGYPPFITNGALRAADKTLIYIGAPTRTVNGRFSMTMEAELKPSLYPSGIFSASITIGIKSSELLAMNGGITLGNPIHCQLNESGIHANDIYGQSQPFTWDRGSNHPLAFAPGKYFQRNGKYLIHLVVEGEEMRVTALGGTIVYRDPRFATMIGDPATHWFYETGGDSLGSNLYRNVWHLLRIWVNAPELDKAEGWGVPSTSNSSPQLPGVSIPQTPQSSANPVSGTAGSKTHLVTVGGSLLAQTGAHEKTTIHGNFANGRGKTLTLQRAGVDLWSTGGLNDSGEWTLEILRVRQNAATYQLHIRFESETTRRFSYHTVTEGSGDSFDLKGSAADDGDIIVRAVLNGGVFR